MHLTTELTTGIKPELATKKYLNWWLLHCVGLVLLCSGCAGTVSNTKSIDSDNQRYRLDKGMLASATGCTIHFTHYLPRNVKGELTLILGHGFLRDQSNMAGLARAVADFGVPVVTLHFCNMSLVKGNHEKNAHDMTLLTKHIAVRKPVYAGFSAGALAALVAAEQDDSTVAVILLDLVDAAGLVQRSLINAEDLTVYALTGAPSACNRQAAATKILEEFKQVEVADFANASHCDFESPTDWLCKQLCGRGITLATNKSNRELIIDKVVRIVAELNNSSS
jgi:hypothetical protein